MIHKTCIIDSKAKISKTAKIGPYTIIGSNVEIEAIRSRGRVWRYKGIAKVNGKKMADAEWAATIVDRNK